jgi:hypothetical protein
MPLSRNHLTSLRLRVDRPLSVHRLLSVHRQNISNGFKRTAIDRMFFYILPFLSSTIYTKLDELTLDSFGNSYQLTLRGDAS